MHMTLAASNAIITSKLSADHPLAACTSSGSGEPTVYYHHDQLVFYVWVEMERERGRGREREVQPAMVIFYL